MNYDSWKLSNDIDEYYRHNRAIGYCKNCGKPVHDEDDYDLDDNYNYICIECIENEEE